MDGEQMSDHGEPHRLDTAEAQSNYVDANRAVGRPRSWRREARHRPPHSAAARAQSVSPRHGRDAVVDRTKRCDKTRRNSGSSNRRRVIHESPARKPAVASPGFSAPGGRSNEVRPSPIWGREMEKLMPKQVGSQNNKSLL